MFPISSQRAPWGMDKRYDRVANGSRTLSVSDRCSPHQILLVLGHQEKFPEDSEFY